ncbi:MAG TPA: porin [Marinobacter hydrocarbonoclasticus]|nr:porin [Marinobacter sp.]HCP22116.1 porin [Marinobacter nauticus]|tara:strand:+ start:592 stop:1758 length:1167 start_codon:yes stop_codon:yes gene_type:complete
MMLMTNRKAALSSALALVMAGLSSPGHAMEFKVSGQLDRAFTVADNGNETDYASVDNIGSNSRFRFTGNEKMANGMNVGFIYEMSVVQFGSTEFDIGKNSGGGDVNLDTRKIDIYLEGDFGKVSFGKGDGAGYYANMMDYSGTLYYGGGAWYTLYSSGISFVDDNGNQLYKIGQTNSVFNAVGRQERIRYDSPSIGGLVLSTSLDNGNAYELAARYHVDLPGAKLATGLSWVDTNDLNIEASPTNGQPLTPGSEFKAKQVLSASASLLLDGGLNFTVSYGNDKTDAMANAGQANQEGFDATNLFGQVGYLTGAHHFAVNYGETKDLIVEGTKGSQIGLAYVYDWSSAVRLFSSYHLYSLDLPSSVKTAEGWGDANDISQLYAGIRVAF